MEDVYIDDARAIAEQAHHLRQRLTVAAQRFGGPTPLLLAVTKQQPAQRINLLKGVGIDQIAESRVQEWQQKSPDLDEAFALHWIGRLQTNKVRYIINRVCLLHSLDRPALAEEIGRCFHETAKGNTRINQRNAGGGSPLPALVQVNIAGETQKAGLDTDDLLPFLRQYGKLPGLSIQGLMAIMPLAADVESLRPHFKEMRRLFDTLQKMTIPGVEMRHLSMGMSADCIVAAQEGATIVRVGSALFGQRSPAPPQDTP